MKRFISLTILFVLVTSSLFAQQYIVSQTIPSSGTSNVPLMTTLSVTFDAALDTELILEAMDEEEDIVLVIPFEGVTSTAIRFLNNDRTIEIDAILRQNTDYYMVFLGVPFADGNILSKPHITYFSTASDISPYTVSGTITIENVTFDDGFTFKSPALSYFNKQNSGIYKRNAHHSTTDVLLQNTIIVLTSESFLDYEEIDEDEENTYIEAIGLSVENGEYIVYNVRPNTYYAYGILFDENAFAFGFYDADEDEVPDPVFVDNHSVTGINFTLFGISFDFGESISSTTLLEEAREIAIGELAGDIYLIDIFANEYIETQKALTPQEINSTLTGKANSWLYSFYSPSLENGVRVVIAPSYNYAEILDNDSFEFPLNEISPLATTIVSSEVAAQIALNNGVQNFLNSLPTESSVSVGLRASAMSQRYADVDMDANTTYWEIGIFATSYDAESNPVYEEMTVVIDAESGQLIHAVSTSIDDSKSEGPSDYILSQNYPNPFNPSTVISFEIPQLAQTNVTVYDLMGRKIATLLNDALVGGSHSITWNASGLSSGIYVVVLETPDFRSTRKMTLLK